MGVNLQANQEGDTGVVCFPAVGSYVIVAFISPAVAAVVLCDKIDRARLSIGQTQITVDAEVVDTSLGDTSFRITPEGVQFNGGKFGGLLKIEQLTEKFNELIRAFNTHTHTIPVGGVPSQEPRRRSRTPLRSWCRPSLKPCPRSRLRTTRTRR